MDDFLKIGKRELLLKIKKGQAILLNLKA